MMSQFFQKISKNSLKAPARTSCANKQISLAVCRHSRLFLAASSSSSAPGWKRKSSPWTLVTVEIQKCKVHITMKSFSLLGWRAFFLLYFYRLMVKFFQFFLRQSSQLLLHNRHQTVYRSLDPYLKTFPNTTIIMKTTATNIINVRNTVWCSRNVQRICISVCGLTNNDVIFSYVKQFISIFSDRNLYVCGWPHEVNC